MASSDCVGRDDFHDSSCDYEAHHPPFVPYTRADMATSDTGMRAGGGLGAPVPKFVGYVPRPGQDLLPAIPALPRPQPVPLSESALALLGSVFQAVSPVQVQSNLNVNGDAHPFPFNLNFRMCSRSNPASGPAAGGGVGRDVLLQSAAGRQGLVQLQSKDEAPLSGVLAQLLRGSQGKGVKLDDQLSIQSIQKATSYTATSDGTATDEQTTRTRWVVKVYDADLKATFEMPLTEIHLTDDSPESFNANLHFIKDAMDAHLNAIHWAYKDSVIQPTLLSLNVPEWAGLLAGFEDVQMRIQSQSGYTVKEVGDSASRLYAAATRSGVANQAPSPSLNNMLTALTGLDPAQPQDDNTVAELTPDFIQLDPIGPEDEPLTHIAQSADWIRRSRHHALHPAASGV